MKLSPKVKASLAVLALGSGAGVVYHRTAPVDVPARGGILQMPRREFSHLRRLVQKGDGLGSMARLNNGLQSGKIRYYKYPTGTSSALTSLRKQASIRGKVADLMKRVRPNTSTLPAEPGPTVADRITKYFKKKPGHTIPLALGAGVLTGYGAWRLSSALRDYRARRAYEQGQVRQVQ